MANFSITDLINARGGKSFSEPAYADSVDYPDSLSIGDTLFPMLYIYYFGKESRRSRVGNTYLFENGLTEYLEARTSIRIGSGPATDPATQAEKFRVMVKKFCLMFEAAYEQNSQWVWMLANAASAAMKKYTSRLSFDPNRPLPGNAYYRQNDPSGGRAKFSPLPNINSSAGADIDQSMESLRILYENKLIPFDYNLGIRPINVFTGGLAEEKEDVVQMQTSARYLGLPSQGVFTVNQTTKGAMMYHTFSGIDITALASLNTVVSRLDHIVSLSWSIHKGTSTNRTLGKSSPIGRVGGGRTIAGTMIFTVSDYHPMRDLIPDNFKGRKSQILNDPDVWKPLVMADEIPPFDVVLTLTNEYGYGAITTLYGVQVVDEGGVFGMDNLITELAIQYTAAAMDPIMEVKIDDNGFIDPFGIMQGGYSQMWRKREMIAAGVGYSDLEQAYEAQYDAVFDSLERMRKRIIAGRRGSPLPHRL